jgi:CDP-paratose 2-epimerase
MNDNYLITGGAGFIGTNCANYYLSNSKRVIIFDNFSRLGTEANIRWLKRRHGKRLTVVSGDLREASADLFKAVEHVEVVLHLAAQVAVTTSVANPREDFEVNALGTFNVLEAVRRSSSKPIVIYSSTNKVYGKMTDLEVTEKAGRYVYARLATGVAETRPLDFYSPYGCSKGIGDQYVVDYARIYGLKTVVFRQSCIYGPHQFGMEDQGWLAWFAIRALQHFPITIYGNGKQVRDVLYIDDLVAAYDAAVTNIAKTDGQAYNMGGGPDNTLSLIELIDLLEEELGYRVEHTFAEWRPGDQMVFISDIQKATKDFGWKPLVSPQVGVRRLVDWLRQNYHLFATIIEKRPAVFNGS